MLSRFALFASACLLYFFFVFFFNDTATTEIYTLSLHDALPIAPATHTLPPLTVTPTGPRATGTLRTTRYVRGSSSTTRSRSWSVIHTPPAPAATFAGGKPSAIVATIRRVRGSIRQSRRSFASPTTQIAPSPVAIPASASRKLPALSRCGYGIRTVASIRTSFADTLSCTTFGQPATQMPYVPLVTLHARMPMPPMCCAPTASNCETFPENWLGPSAATYAYPPWTVTSNGRPIAGIFAVSPDAGRTATAFRHDTR